MDTPLKLQVCVPSLDSPDQTWANQLKPRAQPASKTPNRPKHPSSASQLPPVLLRGGPGHTRTAGEGGRATPGRANASEPRLDVTPLTLGIETVGGLGAMDGGFRTSGVVVQGVQ